MLLQVRIVFFLLFFLFGRIVCRYLRVWRGLGDDRAFLKALSLLFGFLLPAHGPLIAALFDPAPETVKTVGEKKDQGKTCGKHQGNEKKNAQHNSGAGDIEQA